MMTRKYQLKKWAESYISSGASASQDCNLIYKLTKNTPLPNTITQPLVTEADRFLFLKIALLARAAMTTTRSYQRVDAVARLYNIYHIGDERLRGEVQSRLTTASVETKRISDNIKNFLNKAYVVEGFLGILISACIAVEFGLILGTEKPNQLIAFLLLGAALLLMIPGIFLGWRIYVAEQKASSDINQILNEQVVSALPAESRENFQLVIEAFKTFFTNYSRKSVEKNLKAIDALICLHIEALGWHHPENLPGYTELVSPVAVNDDEYLPPPPYDDDEELLLAFVETESMQTPAPPTENPAPTF